MQIQPDDITSLDAQALSAAIHARTLSCREVMQAYLKRIHRLNPIYNAIIHLAADDDLLAQADARDAQLARGISMGWMHGLPHAIKNTAHVLGFPSDFGSLVLQGVMPTTTTLDAGSSTTLASNSTSSPVPVATTVPAPTTTVAAVPSTTVPVATTAVVATTIPTPSSAAPAG